MWTCGIDMATQQAKPAISSSTCSARGDRPSDSGDFTPPVVTEVSCAGGRRRSARESGSIVARQNRPMPK